MPSIVDQVDYHEIRRKVDIAATPDNLPDSAIRDDSNLKAAEDEVIKRVPSSAVFPGSFTEAQQRQLRTAVVLLTAANILPSYPQIVTMNYTGMGGYNRKGEDLWARVAYLKGEAAAIINQVIVEIGTGSDKPIFYTLGTGTRGR